MTWLFEVYVIYRCDVLLMKFLCMSIVIYFEDVTSISWIIFAWFIALIEVGRYSGYGGLRAGEEWGRWRRPSLLKGKKKI